MAIFAKGQGGGAPAAGAAGWLRLAAAPTFAVMAWHAAGGPPAMPLCAPAGQPIDGMAAMYLLMSLFHLSPWLERIAVRPRPTIIQGERS